MNKSEYKEFLDRLKFHHSGQDSHCTTNPIFKVQYLECAYGFKEEYAEGYHWFDPDMDHPCDEQEVIDYCAENSIEFDQWTDEVVDDENCIVFIKHFYNERVVDINCHFTREDAENFIKRKKHDYGEMRVYVDSQYLAREWNDVVKAMINGDLVWMDNCVCNACNC